MTKADSSHRWIDELAVRWLLLSPKDMGGSERRSERRRRGVTARAVAGRVLRDLYGKEGPVGVKIEDLLVFVNERLVAERRSQISQSTLLRARWDEYGF